MAHGAHGDHGQGHDGHLDMNHGDHGDHGNVASAAIAAVTSTVASVLSNLQPNHDIHSGHGAHGAHGGMNPIHGEDPGMDMDDHSGHDMGGMDHSGHDMSGMKMWFHAGYSEIVLFESWKISTLGGLIGSMVGIFFMAALYEGLKYYREYLFWKTYNALQYRSVTLPVEKGVTSEDNQVVHMVGEMVHKQPPTMFSWMHGFQTFLHIIQMVLSYFLMLIFMTYNVWLCMAVVLGAAVGYFLFGWKKPVVVDVTEHCH